MRRSSDGDAVLRVAHDERDVGALGRALGPQLRVVVDRAGDLRHAPQAGGVDQHDRPPVHLDARVDRVAGRARALVHDHPLLSEERVHERRLADVRPADHGDRHGVVVGLLRDGVRRAPRRRACPAGRRCRSRARPDTGTGSPSPSPWNSAASGASSPRSSLFAATIAGTEERRSSSRQLGVAGAQPGGGVDHEQHRSRRPRARTAPGPAPGARATRCRSGPPRRCRPG